MTINIAKPAPVLHPSEEPGYYGDEYYAPVGLQGPPVG
ncbi:hypothetical protein PBI_ELVA_65 [Microbacterium phage Elva]|nr:hypothetical protein QDW20_gp65 [Microbacterium phage Elva]AVR56806.1 hypothetical protein PBI_ELVA_65 [Microbacterium phage Elva]